MKKLLLLGGTALFTFMAQTAQAQIKIGIVDMDKIFKSYYKTKDAEAKINEARTQAKKELDDRMADYSKELDALKKLDEEMKRPELSKASKDEKAKSFDEKRAKLAATEREIREFQGQREKDLQTQAVRMRNAIVEEIQALVQNEVKAQQFNLVLDKSGSSLNGVPIILYANEEWDFSQKIIDQLNKNKGKETSSAPPAATTPAPAPATEKPAKKK